MPCSNFVSGKSNSFLDEINKLKALNGRMRNNNGFFRHFTNSIPILNVKEFLILYNSFASLVAITMLGLFSSDSFFINQIPSQRICSLGGLNFLNDETVAAFFLCRMLLILYIQNLSVKIFASMFAPSWFAGAPRSTILSSSNKHDFSIESFVLISKTIPHPSLSAT